ncbi:SH3 domain-containing protein [bacterium]|nr:SH3 domain-containing protein [bacterium]
MNRKIAVLITVVWFSFPLMAKTHYIRSYEASVFAGPKYSTGKIFKVKRGEKAEELERVGNWIKIDINGQKGWILRLNLIDEKYTEKIVFTPPTNVEKQKKRRNIRLRTARAVVGVKGLRASTKNKLQEEDTDYKALEEIEQFKVNEDEAIAFLLDYQE